MDKYLRPSRFEVDANATGADKQWSHWYKTFSNFLDAIAEHEPDKLVTLTNYVAPNVYEYIAECTTYETAIETLEALYLKPTNEIYARHVLCRYQFDRLPSPPALTAGPLIFSVKIPTPGTAFQRKTPAPGHNLPCSNAKRSMKKEHNSIKAVSFQIFQFSIIVHLTIFFFREYKVFASLYITLKINTV